MMLKIVVLPQPLGPMMLTKSCSWISKAQTVEDANLGTFAAKDL